LDDLYECTECKEGYVKNGYFCEKKEWKYKYKLLAIEQNIISVNQQTERILYYIIE
jgi:hypothetical protein